MCVLVHGVSVVVLIMLLLCRVVVGCVFRCCRVITIVTRYCCWSLFVKCRSMISIVIVSWCSLFLSSSALWFVVVARCFSPVMVFYYY